MRRAGCSSPATRPVQVANTAGRLAQTSPPLQVGDRVQQADGSMWVLIDPAHIGDAAGWIQIAAGTTLQDKITALQEALPTGWPKIPASASSWRR